MKKIYIYGRHVLMEALREAPALLHTVFLSPNIEDKELRQALQKARISPEKLSPHVLRGVGENAVHQGVVGVISEEKLLRSYKDFFKDFSPANHSSLVLLDEIQDTQNVGAVIRSAVAFGASAVLIPSHNQAPISGAAIKASAGMAFRIPIVEVGNVNEALRDLKKRGFWIYGLDEKAEKSISLEVFDAPAVFVLGNEAEGIRLKTRELCDVLLKIPIEEGCESLNVSASAAIALYAWNASSKKTE